MESTPRQMFFPIMSQPQAQINNVKLQIPPILERLRACQKVDRANLIEIVIYAHNIHSRLDEAVEQCDVKFSESFPQLDLGFTLTSQETFLHMSLLAGDNLNEELPQCGGGR